MALFQPPPTVVLPTLGEGPTAVYHPIWARWFVDLIDTLNTTVGGGGSSATLANAVFARKEIPGTGIFQPDMQAVQAIRSFTAVPVRQETPSGDMNSILASQIFGG